MPSVQSAVIGRAVPLPPLQRDEVRATGQDVCQTGRSRSSFHTADVEQTPDDCLPFWDSVYS